MSPDEYEEIVAESFRALGYEVSVTPYSNDYGVDLFASKGQEKIAVQAKMYGNTTRKINRQMVMELHGAKDYFDCDKAVIATDGYILDDAMKVAEKLAIEVINIPAVKPNPGDRGKAVKRRPFEEFWERYVMPLEGKTLIKDNGKTNEIVKVDWSGIERITSNGRRQTIKIEIFRKVVNHLFEHGSITRDYINLEYIARASSGIVLILSNTPMFEKTSRPIGLKMIHTGG